MELSTYVPPKGRNDDAPCRPFSQSVEFCRITLIMASWAQPGSARARYRNAGRARAARGRKGVAPPGVDAGNLNYRVYSFYSFSLWSIHRPFGGEEHSSRGNVMSAFRFTQIVGLAATMGLAACLPETAHANLVTNGGFETGDLDGWEVTGNTSFTGVSDGVSHSGDFAAVLGPVGSLGFLSQEIATIPGQAYAVSLWLQNFDGGTNSFTASFDNEVVVPQITDADAFDYTFYSSNIIATAAFTNLIIGGYRNDPSIWIVDDIDVSAVPLPAALPLLASGLLGLGAVGWRRRQIA
jgi:hypothetical protein